MSTISLDFSKDSFHNQVEENLPYSITPIGGSLDEFDKPTDLEKSISPISFKPSTIIAILIQTFKTSPEDVNLDRHLMIASTSSPKHLQSKKPSIRRKKSQPKRSLSTYFSVINSHWALQKVLYKYWYLRNVVVDFLQPNDSVISVREGFTCCYELSIKLDLCFLIHHSI